jgi:single-stranded-DNA-specific exonuclease
MQKYIVRPAADPIASAELAGYPPLVRHLLYHRGITTKNAADNFLNPDYERGIHDPFLMKDMEKAVGRILSAIEKGEKIVIYSDYDADGIPGGVIVHDFFKKIGFNNFINYFPHRFEEGYGLHVAAVEGFKADGAHLIITIDCGTSDVAAVVRARELGIDVIITDHHLSQEDKLPPAYAIVNPKQKDCTYPYNMLCGSGIAYKLVQAILKKNNFGLKEGMEKWFLDMVGFATLADMVPLRDENRIFAHYGLRVLRKTPRLGLRKLLDKAKVKREFLNEEDIGFTLAPRINAASRMGKPSEAFELLTAFDETHAEQISSYLTKINDERKGAASLMSREARKMLASRMEQGSLEAPVRKVLVLGNPKWKPALIGPVCNTIVEETGLPVFMWGRSDGEHIKGSCRSNGSVNVLELMKGVLPGILLGFGGHAMSGGFSISHEKIHLLEDELNKAHEQLHGLSDTPVPEEYVEARLSMDDVNWLTFNAIETLSPFGIDNPRPIFMFENVPIFGVKRFGKEKNHLELQFKNSKGATVHAIGFFMSPESFKMNIDQGAIVNLIASMEKSHFKHFPELRLRIIDII